MPPELVRKFGTSGIVHVVSVIKYFGKSNSLEEYYQYYHIHVENGVVNFVWALTIKDVRPLLTAQSRLT